mmetsp:Transcript_24138/g.91082  ORF Transcript_24138/g.91082 Transcript_24138/m.91082 type:complete len:268 (+) Transcript_24138:698-1501(+)
MPLRSFREKSRQGYPCVRLPMLRTSTPGRMYDPRVSSRMPPLASTSTCGKAALNAAAAASRASGSKLSSITTSAPAAAASLASSSVRASTSILLEKPHAERALATAFGMEPAAHTWLSLIMVIWLRSMRCVPQPPTSKAYFSTRRKPGVSLRVPATSPAQPLEALIAAALAASVAMPLALVRMLSAVRSPRRSMRRGPRTVATCATGEMVSPSGASHSTVHPSLRNTQSKKGTPASTPADFPRSQASSSSEPTTKPPTSKLGVSSAR